MRGGTRAPPGRGGINIPAIIAATAVAVAAAAMQGYAASPQPPAAFGGGARGITPMKLLHLRFV